jgi:hypothetical protein
VENKEGKPVETIDRVDKMAKKEQAGADLTWLKLSDTQSPCLSYLF